MNIIILSWRYLWSRPLAASLNLLPLALWQASISFVLLISQQINRAFERASQVLMWWSVPKAARCD